MRKRAIITCTLALAFASSIFAQLDPQEAVLQMRRGINMGNTLEPPLEGGWNNPSASEYYFDLYRDAGFDMVRIPVRWNNHTSTSAPFHVDDAWMDRVEEIVDWGLSRDLFIVINTHHEEWIKANYTNPVNRARFDSIWSQIATRFKDKPEKLIFEIINEPKGLTQTQNNELHERVLGIIRRTNPTRNVIIQGHEWGGAEQLVSMAIPDDEYLIGSFHSYDPWPFGLEGTGSFGSSHQLQVLENKFIMVDEWSKRTGIPIFLGEFACHKGADYNSRMKHYRAYMNFSLKYGFTPVAWDDGGNFGVMLRSARSWNEIKDILIYCDLNSPTISHLSVEEDSLIYLQWNSGTRVIESLSIQRKTGWGAFSTIATLDADATSYMDASAGENKDHYYRIVAHQPGDQVCHSNPLHIFLPKITLKVRGYYLGKPHSIPGTIEAEDYDPGGEGLTYHELDDKNIAGAYRPDEAVDIYALGDAYHVGNALPGEWMEYSMDVEQAGDYFVDVSCAAQTTGGRFLVSIGDFVSDTMEINPSGSWMETAKTSFTAELPEGEQIMRFTIINSPQFNIDKFEFSKNTTGFQEENWTKNDLVLFQEINGDLLIKSSQSTILSKVQVFHISGCLFASSNKPSDLHRITGDKLGKGIYLVRTQEENRVLTKKIVLQ